MKINKYTNLLLILGILLGSCEGDIIKGLQPEEAFIKYYGDYLDQEVAEVMPALDGGFILLGTIDQKNNNSPVNRSIYLVKIKENGNEDWSEIFPEPGYNLLAGGIDTLSGNNSYVIGATAFDADSNASPYIFRIDVDGNPASKEMIVDIEKSPRDVYETVHDILFTKDGNVIFGGNHRAIGEDDILLNDDEINRKFDTYLMKVRLDGSPHPNWDAYRVWGYPEQDQLAQIREFSINNYSVLGTTHHDEAGQGGTNILFYTSNTEGVPIHAQTIGEDANEEASDMIQHSNGNISLIGTQYDSQGRSAIFLARLEGASRLNRESLSIEREDANFSETGVSLALLPDGNSYVLAGTVIPENETDIYLLKSSFSPIPELRNSFPQNEEPETANVLVLEDGFLVAATVKFGGTRMMCLIKTNEELELND